jgi:hypothetical protein
MTTKIIGNALYLELVANPELSEDDQKKFLGWQESGVKQVIVFPSVDRGSEASPLRSAPIVMTRVIHSYSPRAQWDWELPRRNVKPESLADVLARTSEDDSYLNLEYYSKDEWSALSHTSKMLSHATELGLILNDQLLARSYDWEGDKRQIKVVQAWQVRNNEPIAVEFTEDDHDLAIARTTPQAVIRRINKVRGTLDKFPEKLVKFA